MLNLFKAVLPTCILFAMAVVISTLLFLEVSQAWAGFIFLVFAVFIGIPLAGKGAKRLWRLGLFVIGMIVFMLFAYLAMPYSPFGAPAPFSGHYADKTHQIDVSAVVRKVRHVKRYHYYLYRSDIGDVWLLNGDHFTQAKIATGHFVPAPATERDFFLQHYGSEVSAPDDTWIVGHLLTDRDASIAVTKQNMTFALCLLLWAALFILEEAHFRRPRKIHPRKKTTKNPT